jgi:hypothetical protein
MLISKQVQKNKKRKTKMSPEPNAISERDARIRDHEEATDVLMEMSDEPMSPADKAAFDVLVTERREYAAQHLADLVERNHDKLVSADGAAQARHELGHMHK